MTTIENVFRHQDVKVEAEYPSPTSAQPHSPLPPSEAASPPVLHHPNRPMSAADRAPIYVILPPTEQQNSSAASVAGNCYYRFSETFYSKYLLPRHIFWSKETQPNNKLHTAEALCNHFSFTTNTL